MNEDDIGNKGHTYVSFYEFREVGIPDVVNVGPLEQSDALFVGLKTNFTLWHLFCIKNPKLHPRKIISGTSSTLKASSK